MFPEPVQFGILLEIAFDIVQDTRNIGEEIGIAFDAIDVDEPPRRLEVTLMLVKSNRRRKASRLVHTCRCIANLDRKSVV